jgi:GDPmannose 4,6-dehydratase
MFNTCGILFNHESERRGLQFITRKISDGVARIAHGISDTMTLGNLDAKRDGGYAGDYVEAMWMMLQSEPDDYVIATGEQYSVRDFVEESASYFGFDIEWVGQGLDEVGVDKNTGKTIVRIDDKYFRPAEVETLLGDATKAKEILGWVPKVSFKELVKEMCLYE